MGHFEKLASIFDEALTRAFDQRDEYIRQACKGDLELYRDVLSLIEHHEESIDTDAWGASAAAAILTETRLEPGQHLGPYEVDSWVANGGMSSVYRAIDTRLGREVAIKVVSDAFSRQFADEIRLTAALNHPNICQLYDVGVNYLVMEFVDGPTLADRLRARIPLIDATHYARQVLDALDYAHGKGVVHCDLKPGNLKIRLDGVVKVLDFGLSRQVHGASPGETSEVSAIFGTRPYMAPEQLEGRLPDERSDIFSFGLVLSEMLYGERPTIQKVGGDYRVGLPSRTLLPPRLATIVERCLEVSPINRFQTIKAIKSRLLHGSPELEGRTAAIAVLPFADVTGESDIEYFGEGLAEEVIHSLGKVPELLTTARTSAFAFRVPPVDVAHIAAALDVDYVLTGTVQRHDDRVVVSVDLRATSDGSSLWSRRYERELYNVFGVQDEIASAIATALNVQARRQERVIRSRPMPAAYEAFLKGRHHGFKMTPSGVARARECFEEAIAIDPTYANPYEELATQGLLGSLAGAQPLKDVAGTARRLASKALELDSGSARSRALLTSLSCAVDYLWTGADERFRSALTLDQNSGDIRYLYAYTYLIPVGRLTEAADVLERAMHADPLNVFWRINLAGVWYLAERYDRALREVHKTLEVGETYWICYLGLGATRLAQGAVGDAIAAFERAHELAPWHPQVVGYLAGAVTRAGDEERGRALVADLSERLPEHSVMTQAIYHCLCSHLDDAAQSIQSAIERRDPAMLVYIRNPITRPLQNAKYWPSILQMMNLPAT
jgi:serine/threonine-protein kinase